MWLTCVMLRVADRETACCACRMLREVSCHIRHQTVWPCLHHPGGQPQPDAQPPESPHTCSSEQRSPNGWQISSRAADKEPSAENSVTAVSNQARFPTAVLTHMHLPRPTSSL